MFGVYPRASGESDSFRSTMLFRRDYCRTMSAIDGVPRAIPSLGRVRNREEAEAKFGRNRVDTYVGGLMRGDPLADAFASDCAKIGRATGMAMLARWLDGEPIDSIEGAPDSLRALAAQVEATPAYVNFEQIDRGAAAFSRNAREAGIALSTTSLVSGYNNSSASKPLIVTGRFSEMAPVRAIETSMWVFSVGRPGGLHRDSEGFKRTIRVRMIHAFVRRHILSSVEWDTHRDGVPINQADLAYTVVEFMWLPVRSVQRLGIYYTPEDLEAIYALWRYMGYLMGVDEDLLVRNGREAQSLENLHMALSPPPDDDCRLLTHVLLTDVLAVDLKQASGAIGLVGRRYGRQFVQGLTRAFVGKSIADNLDIDDTAWQYLPKVVSPAMNVVSRLRYLVPGANDRRMRRSLAEVDNLLAVNSRERGMVHDLVDHAAESRDAVAHPASTT